MNDNVSKDEIMRTATALFIAGGSDELATHFQNRFERPGVDQEMLKTMRERMCEAVNLSVEIARFVEHENVDAMLGR